MEMLSTLFKKSKCQRMPCTYVSCANNVQQCWRHGDTNSFSERFRKMGLPQTGILPGGTGSRHRRREKEDREKSGIETNDTKTTFFCRTESRFSWVHPGLGTGKVRRCRRECPPPTLHVWLWLAQYPATHKGDAHTQSNIYRKGERKCQIVDRLFFTHFPECI